MFHNTEFHPEANVYIITFQTGWHTKEGTQERVNIVRRALQAAEEPLTLIFDLTYITMRFDGVMRATNSLARGQDAPFRHPMCKKIVVVTTNTLVHHVAHGLRTETFGKLPVLVHKSQEEAWEEARKPD